MMVLWEKENINEKMLGEMVHLKSNTLAPLLKKLKEKNYIDIRKNKGDERNLVISLTPTGLKLKDKAVNVPEEISKTLNISAEEAAYLYSILYKVLDEKENAE